MKKYLPLFGFCVVLSLFVCSVWGQDDNPGAALLDQATEEKMKAASTDDLAKVIALCLQAKQEGLSGENLNYCNQLLASTQLQRGLFNARRLISVAQKLPQNWAAARKLALDDLENAVKVVDKQSLPFLLIAQLNLLPEGDTKRAAEALDLAEQNAKDDPDAVAQITTLKLSLQDDPAKREELLANAVQKNPMDSRLMILHAGSLLDLKNRDGAIDVLKKLVGKEPDNVAALRLLVGLLAEAKQFDEAISMIEVLEKMDDGPPKDELLLEKAKVYVQMEKTEEAIKHLNDLRERNPNNPLILIIRAEVYQGAKDYDNALKDIDAALRILPGHVPFQVIKTEVLLDKGDVAAARKLIEELVKENEGNLQLSILLIRTLLDAKEFDKAIELIGKIKSEHGEQIDATKLSLMKIQILSAAKKSRQALEELNPMLEQDPENIEFLRIKGNLFLAINRHSDAVKTFETVLTTEPDDEMILNNLSWVLSTSPNDMIRNGQKALELAEKACKLSEYKKAYILSTLAAAHAELGDFDKALEWSQKCIELAEKDPTDKERLDDLKKELESYKKKQPYREAMEE